MASGGDRTKSLQDVLHCLHHCTELEVWGLMVESSDEYLKASRKLNHITSPEVDSFSSDEKSLLARIADVLQVKGKSLQNLSSVQESSSTDNINVKLIIKALDGLMEGSMSVSTMESSLAGTLPPPVEEGQEPQGRALVLAEDEYSKLAQGKSGSLLCRRDMLPGYSYLTITIDNIGIKDPHNYLDPFITVSVKSLYGDDVEGSQDTPVTNQREASKITFNVSVLIDTPIEDMPGGAAIFFELKHYKPKKKCVSTKCFSFMEMDEVKPGKSALEIYKKPTDFRRKKLSLLSIKPLYLQLSLSVDKPS